MITLTTPVHSELREVFNTLETGDIIQFNKYPRSRITGWAKYYGVRCRVNKHEGGFRVTCVERFAPPPGWRPRKHRRKSLRERMDLLDIKGGISLEREEWELAIVAVRLFEKQGEKRFKMQSVGRNDFDLIRTH